MRRSRCRSSLIALAAGLLVVAAGCGDMGNDIVAPDESTVEFMQGDLTKTLSPAGSCVATFTATDFGAVVRNGDGKPLNNVNVTFQLSLPNIVFVDALGNIIGQDPITGRSSITRHTDENGVVTVTVAIPDCPTGDDLWAISGTASAKVHITVN